MIKVSKISYEMLNKEVLLDVMLKAENNSKFKKTSAVLFNSNSKSARKRKTCDDNEERNKEDFGTKRRRSN